MNSPAKPNKKIIYSPVRANMNSPARRQILNNNNQTPLQQKAVKRKIETTNDSPVPAQIIKKAVEKFEIDSPMPLITNSNSQPNTKETQNKENNSQSPSRIPISIKSPLMSPLKSSQNQYQSPLPSKKPRMLSPDSKIPIKRDLKAELDTPSKEKLMGFHTPKRSLLKRILATATPGHSQFSQPRILTTSDSTKNLTMTKYTDPQECIDKLIDGLSIKGVECKQKGYTIRCVMNNKFASVLTFNLEVCQFHGSIAIQRKRLRGDAWNYKKICEEILRISNSPQLLTTDI